MPVIYRPLIRVATVIPVKRTVSRQAISTGMLRAWAIHKRLVRTVGLIPMKRTVGYQTISTGRLSVQIVHTPLIRTVKVIPVKKTVVHRTRSTKTLKVIHVPSVRTVGDTRQKTITARCTRKKTVAPSMTAATSALTGSLVQLTSWCSVAGKVRQHHTLRPTESGPSTRPTSGRRQERGAIPCQPLHRHGYNSGRTTPCSSRKKVGQMVEPTVRPVAAEVVQEACPDSTACACLPLTSEILTTATPFQDQTRASEVPRAVRLPRTSCTVMQTCGETGRVPHHLLLHPDLPRKDRRRKLSASRKKTTTGLRRCSTRGSLRRRPFSVPFLTLQALAVGLWTLRRLTAAIGEAQPW